MEKEIILWVVFWTVFLVVLILDLFVFFRKHSEINVGKAFFLSFTWMIIALFYSVLIFLYEGTTSGVEYITAYFVEWSLSVDNLFVFLVIFTFFSVPKEYQHQVLFWGVLGAVVFRGIFIFLGVSLVNQFSWLFVVFGVFLVYTAFVLLFKKDDEQVKIENRFAYKLARKLFNITPDYINGYFFKKIDGKIWATPLFLCLIMIESTDILFAIDSIPAVLGISTHPLVVFTSNIFAVMGLRSMYFALAGIMGIFKFLKYGLSIVLAYIGLKMIVKELLHIKIDSFISLLIVLSILGISVLLSLIIKDKRAGV
ncbi:MAG: TerC/Alx family metal homeostasis membrane protein [Brevinematia bacterium]